MNHIDDKDFPYLMREADERNAILRGVWWVKYQRRASYADQRENGAKTDAKRVEARRLARHAFNTAQERKLSQDRKRGLGMPQRESNVVRYLRQAD